MTYPAQGQSAVLMLCPLPAPVQQNIEEKYSVLCAWEFDDPYAKIAERADSVIAIVTSGATGVDDRWLDLLPRLSVIASFGVGTDGINLQRIAELGVQVSITPGVLDDCVADTALGLLIDVVRGISLADRFVRNGGWLKAGFPLQPRLRGKVCGIAGMGNIGRAIAARAQAFGMQVAYCARREVPGLALTHYDDIKALAEVSDFLVLALPGGLNTRHLVNKDVLQALGASGFLINVSRGSVVDKLALVEALETGGIAGAGLDVFSDEPHVPDALLALDNVVLTPHVASATTETRAAMAQLVWDNLEAFFHTGAVLTPVKAG